MLRRARITGWSLLGVTVILIPLIVLIRAATSHGSEPFNRWVGWSTLWALPVAAVGIVLLVWEKIERALAETQTELDDAQKQLARIVLIKSRDARSLLLGTDTPGDSAANVRFIKSFGRFRQVGGSYEGNLLSILKYYQQLSPGRLVVLGEAGSGKTVLALELIIQMLENRNKNDPVPVLVSAAAWNTNLAAEKWLSQHLARQFGMNSKSIAELVADRRIIPVADGLDEMDSAGDRQRARKVVDALNRYMKARQRGAAIITCRSEAYDDLGVGVDRATHIKMIPLNGTEAAAYLADHIRDASDERRWRPVLHELRNQQHGLLARELATPWRLTLSVAAFRESGEPSTLLPTYSKNPVSPLDETDYKTRINALLLDRYVSSAVALYGPDGRYSREEIDLWLTTLTTCLEWQSKNDMSGTDIELHQWWKVISRKGIPLIHVAVAAIPAIPILAVATAARSTGWLMAGIFLLLMALVGSGDFQPTRMGIRQLKTPYGRRRLIAGLELGLAVALAVGLVFGLAVGFYGGPLPGIEFGSTLGGGVGFIVGLASGLSDLSPQIVGPRDVIRADGIFGLVFGILTALVVGPAVGLAGRLTGALTGGPISGLTVGLAFGLTFSLAFGAHPWVRYHIAVTAAALQGRAPIRFAALLAWAREARLLRESGIAYQFRHRQLQDWLFARSDQSP